MVFSGRTSRELGDRIADDLGITLGDVNLKTFANGEIYVRFEESIRGADIFLVQSTAQPVNDSLMELLIMIDAAKLASAHRINAVIPWYGYSRQDKKSAPREPITAKLVAELLQAAGVDRVLTMDLHAGQVQGFFRIPVDHMTAVPLIVEHFRERKERGELVRPVVVSPDAGRAKLANHVAEDLGADLAVLTKQRPEHNSAEITLLVGDVAGKDAILIDDMIDTAGTLVAGANTIKAAGARRVYSAAVHGLFSGPAFERLRGSAIEEVVITDTVPLPPDAPHDLLKIVSVSKILADSIHNVFCDESVSEIFAGQNQLF
ncbi:MAG: ribose-phosphate pyrophosphokinase [Actinobacteria bacterium]|nr:ribose-phosphate pyrophosphokinase [Thermoleophilia bacterium]MCB9011768.1 ribose-phosphate pyrophosphokinase [Actinomycetota bacterium]